jgi:hypothetical protein
MTDCGGGATKIGDVHRELLAAAITTPPGEPADIAVGRLILSAGIPMVIDRTARSTLVMVERGSLDITATGSVVERAPGEVQLIPQTTRTTIGSSGDGPVVAVVVMMTPAGANTDQLNAVGLASTRNLSSSPQE